MSPEIFPPKSDPPLAENLKSKISSFPKSPGVYQFKNKDAEVIYVGKAKNLKSRVSQYFSGHDDRPQLPYLMAEATDVTYTVVNNELESLFLESTLIKQYMPRYNIMLRDDKNYAFITIDYNFEIPQIGYSRKISNDSQSKIKHFGPYSAAYKIRNTLNLVRRIFPYCAAQKVGSRPCFYYYMHRCPGVCVGKISLDEYRLQLKKIEDFLAGNTSKIKKDLENEMKLASNKQQFEKAARLRDQCNALTLLDERQTVILPKPVFWDIVSVAQESGYACVNLFKIREGKMADKENFIYETHTPDFDGRQNREYPEIIQKFLEQYYLETSSFPKNIYTQTVAEDPKLIEKISLSRIGKKIELSVPQKGKLSKLINLGQINAEEYLKNWLSSQAGNLDKINKALSELKEVLQLNKTPDRIECYDISNIQGTNAVGSMVVFEKGLPKKSQYRKFRIKTKQTPDDFAMMKEMLSRRFARSLPSFSRRGLGEAEGVVGALPIEAPTPSSPDGATPPLQGEELRSWPLPDLVVIDGGKGQLSAAIEVLQATSYKLPAIPLIGLAKRIEETFLPNNPNPIILPHDNPALQLLQRLRDEAHRFGITYHRALRSKQAVRSALDDIPGIGPQTKKLLKQKFGTVANIRKTKFDDLAKEVGERIAQLIVQSL